jgi:hypothetical protein
MGASEEQTELSSAGGRINRVGFVPGARRRGLRISKVILAFVITAGCSASKVSTRPTSTSGSVKTVTTVTSTKAAAAQASTSTALLPTSSGVGASTTIASEVKGTSILPPTVKGSSPTTKTVTTEGSVGSAAADDTTTTVGPTTTTIAPTTTTTAPQPQSISVDDARLAGTWRYGTALTVGATASSGLDVDVSSSGACEFSNPATLTLRATTVGVCNLRFTQPGDGKNWAAAASVNRSITVSKGQPVISNFSNQTIENPITETFQLTLSAAAGAAPLTYSAAYRGSASGTECVINGSVLTLNLAYSFPVDCDVRAEVVASNLYEAAFKTATITITASTVRVVSVSKPAQSKTGTVTTATFTVTLSTSWNLDVSQGTCDSITHVLGAAETHTVTVTFTNACQATVRPDASNVTIRVPPAVAVDLVP